MVSSKVLIIGILVVAVIVFIAISNSNSPTGAFLDNQNEIVNDNSTTTVIATTAIITTIPTTTTTTTIRSSAGGGGGGGSATTVPATTTTIPTTTTTIETTTTIPEQTHFSSPVATNKWMNVYGNITISGLPAQVGDEVAAFDPQNVLCGTFRVTTAGQYGFLHVYADDTTTVADEGAVSGDVITFKVFDASENKEINATQSTVWSEFATQNIAIY